MKQPKPRNRKLWGIEFQGANKKDRPMIISTTWLYPVQTSNYNGEPVRALLFMTRQQAREWCRAQMEKYAGRGDFLSRWKFRPVRVVETVRKIGP